MRRLEITLIPSHFSRVQESAFVDKRLDLVASWISAEFILRAVLENLSGNTADEVARDHVAGFFSSGSLLSELVEFSLLVVALAFAIVDGGRCNLISSFN